MKKLETLKSIAMFLGMTLLFLTEIPVLEGNKPARIIAFVLLAGVLIYFFAEAFINIKNHLRQKQHQ